MGVLKASGTHCKSNKIHLALRRVSAYILPNGTGEMGRFNNVLED